MSENIKDQVIYQLKLANPFALQLDKFMDVSFCAQLIVFMRYIHNGEFKDKFLYLINLPSKTRGDEIYQAFDIFSRKVIAYGNCCADYVQMVLQLC